MFAIVSNSMAQDITINLSIRWNSHIESNGKTIQTPILDITYINNSTMKNYYLLKQSRPYIINSILPQFYNDKMIGAYRYNYINHKKNEEKYLQKTNRLYSERFFAQKYYITIDNERLLFYTGWSAKKDTLMHEYYENFDYNNYLGIKLKGDTTEKHHYDRIQYELIDIYDSIHIYSYGNDYCARETFLRTEFTDSTISNSSIDNFVFLKPQEQYITSHNLYGLKLVGGNFEILLKKNVISDEVCNMTLWDGEHFHDIHIKLPHEVNGYQLYTGKFKTNHAFLEITK